MEAKRPFGIGCFGIGPIAVFSLFMLSGFDISLAANSGSATPERYRVFSLKHISAGEGIDYLSDAGIGTVSKLPSPDTLLVTASSRDLVKVSAILGLVDSNRDYAIAEISSTSDVRNLPTNNQIQGRLENTVIGTFSDPPADDAKFKSIIDIHGSSVLAIVQVDQLDNVIKTIEMLGKSKVAPKAIDLPEPNESTGTSVIKAKEITLSEALDAKTEVDKYLAELVDSLPEEKLGETQVREIIISDNKVHDAAECKNAGCKVCAEGLAEVVEFVEEMPVKQTAEVVSESISLVPKAKAVMVKRSYEPERVDIGDETLELNLPEKLNIIDLLDLVGKYLQLDYLYDAAKVKGEVALKVQGPIKVKELYPLVESVMKFKGFVMSRKGNLVTIVPSGEVLDIDPTLLKADENKVQYGDVIVTRPFKLNYIDTTSAHNLLVAMRLGVNISPIAETQTLIVTGYAYRMNRIEELLEMVDLPGEMKEFRYRQLKYTMATTLAPKVEKLAGQLSDISITIAATAAPKPAPRKGKRKPKKKAPTPSAQKTTGPTVYLDFDERTNRLLMIGLEEQLDIVESLVDTLDVEQQDLRRLKLYEIQHVGAEEVEEKLAALGVISGVSRTTTTKRTTKTKKSKSPAQSQITASEDALTEEPQVVIIESTNSLLVNATEEQHTQIALIIAYVDSETEDAAIPYKVYALENQDPEELAAIINKLILETVKDKQGKVEKTVKKTDEDIEIIPDPATYSLIVYANKKNQQWIGSLIKQLDEYRPQVLLDCTLVEISKDDLFEYDLKIATKTYGGRTRQPGAPEKLGTAGSEFSSSRLLDAFTSGGEIFTFFNSSKVQWLLEAIETKGYGRIMARPKILVNDNQEGEIKTENTAHIAQVTTDVQIPSDGFPVTNTSVTFVPYVEGVTLNIKPHISKGNMLRLEISLNRTDFDEQLPVILTEGGEARTFPSPPDLLSTDITTVSTVPDGTTIVLGGLEGIDQKKSHSKVPILGDIPLIGGLFRTINNDSNQDKLYIFVRASIIRPGDQLGGMEDIRRVSDSHRREFERLEKEFQEAKDWPGFKPQPMDPLKILEQE